MKGCNTELYIRAVETTAIPASIQSRYIYVQSVLTLCKSSYHGSKLFHLTEIAPWALKIGNYISEK